ncbi:hemin ABC transporter substrate-binding protein [Shewanella baltica]|uniref:hemin ABC transporter substrate-binding protein n=1 Tax=Shewanella baltica TaxID=62322 RepID=UPI00217D7B99|nr:hemin ABC transporter substrate-binding protein [Shewanella baltica]MCS6235776.1 hemin ABC transporter substrate-binding protein [Shewanella baltica]MCS6259194.1 hemin ABC transporter substrate-binding protein [Shewanella baltica]MCS6270393.1 hemin ABC transporter substrate-binding protein [Shewanella baltica]
MLFQATKMSLKIDTSALGHPHKPKCAFNPLSRFKPLSKVVFIASAFAVLLSSSAFSAETHSEHEIRLVSAGTGVTELVLALDAGNELVAIDSTSYVPDGLSHVAKLGYHRMLSAEGIIALSPTLVVGSDVMGPETTLNVLKQAHIQVVQLPATNDEPQLMSNVDTLGQLLNRPDNAIKLKQDLHQQLQSLADKKQQISDAGAQPKILFMLLQEGRGARVGGKGTAADTIIALSGAQNIAEFDGYKSMSQEGILSLQPDIILLSKRSDKPTEQTNAQIAQELIKEMPLLAHTPAGKNGHIQTLAPQALLGGLGISAISAADTLASTLLKQNQ